MTIWLLSLSLILLNSICKVDVKVMETTFWFELGLGNSIIPALLLAINASPLTLSFPSKSNTLFSLLINLLIIRITLNFVIFFRWFKPQSKAYGITLTFISRHKLIMKN